MGSFMSSAFYRLRLLKHVETCSQKRQQTSGRLILQRKCKQGTCGQEGRHEHALHNDPQRRYVLDHFRTRFSTGVAFRILQRGAYFTSDIFRSCFFWCLTWDAMADISFTLGVALKDPFLHFSASARIAAVGWLWIKVDSQNRGHRTCCNASSGLYRWVASHCLQTTAVRITGVPWILGFTTDWGSCKQPRRKSTNLGIAQMLANVANAW